MGLKTGWLTKEKFLQLLGIIWAKTRGIFPVGFTKFWSHEFTVIVENIAKYNLKSSTWDTKDSTSTKEYSNKSHFKHRVYGAVLTTAGV